MCKTGFESGLRVHGKSFLIIHGVLSGGGAGPAEPQSSPEPGTSRSATAPLTAPDLQLDCLDDDDEEDDGDQSERSHEDTRICIDLLESGSSDAATTSNDSGEDGHSAQHTSSHSSSSSRPQRFRSSSTSDSVAPQPKIRRLNSHRDPFGHGNSNDVLSHHNSLYVPHALMLRRQQLQRELHRRFRTYTYSREDEENGTELELPLTNALARHRLLISQSGMGIESRLNRLLQLIGVRGLNTGLRQEVIEQHTVTSKFLAEDVTEREEDRDKCTICLVNYECDEEIRTLNCKHCFHSNCVDRWLKCNRQCPMCRVNVDAAIAKTQISTAPSEDHPPAPPPEPPSLS